MWDSEQEPPSYGGEVQRIVEYLVTCFNCLAVQAYQVALRGEAVARMRDAGWKDIDPDGWCCPTCLPTLRKGKRR